jgi:hypothetical protein
VDKELSIAGAGGVTFDKYAVVSLPAFVVIDANGVINPQVSPYNLEERIQELVSD